MDRKLLTKKSMAVTVIVQLNPQSSVERILEKIERRGHPLRRHFNGLMKQPKEHLEDLYNMALRAKETK